MEHLEALLYIVQELSRENFIISVIAGVSGTFIESFLPFLPLAAIVSANAVANGMFIGLIISWIGSGLGTTALFLLLSKFNESKLVRKIKTPRIESGIQWVNNKGFSALFIAYSCPFMPSSLATVASALCNKKIVDFIPAMLAGKFVMFITICYIAGDVTGFIKSPVKIALFALLIAFSWYMGKRLNRNLERHEQELMEKTNQIKDNYEKKHSKHTKDINKKNDNKMM